MEKNKKFQVDEIINCCIKDAKTGEIIENSCSCQMCKRMVINAGIAKVIVRNTKTEYTVYDVRDWIMNDDSLSGKFGY